MSALYVVFEGIDGCGKTTQAKRLFQRFVAAKVERTAHRVEPSHEPVGDEIRRRLLEGPPLEPWEALGLFVADRRAVLPSLMFDLETAEVLVQDRSYFSTAVYQGGEVRHGFNDFKQMCPPWQAIVTWHERWMPKPDLVLLLDLRADEACRRIEQRGMPTSFETQETLTRHRDRYRQVLTESIPEALVILDATKPADELEEAVWSIAVRRLTDKKIEASHA